MIEAETSAFLEPVSAEAPCGPDLDTVGDSDFMSYLLEVEGRFPASYFAFKPENFDFDGLTATGVSLLGRSRDVRLLVVLARIAILERNLAGFSTWLDLLAKLMVERWDDINPRDEDGDFLARMAPIYTLDTTASVIQPLQHVTLASNRDGVVTFRAFLLSEGDVRPRVMRDGDNELTEPVLTKATIERILDSVDLDALARTRDVLASIRASLAGIRKVSTEKAGFEQAVKLEALPPVIDRMVGFIEAVLKRRDPLADSTAESEAPEGAGDVEAGEGEKRPNEIASRADAAGALKAAMAYFERFEPSSPALLLLQQARQLVGKNLFEVLQLLLPNQVDGAGLHVGSEPSFMVPANVLADVSSVDESFEATEIPAAETRQAALQLIDQAAAHFRKTEPSSPVPLLLDRARVLASRDFLNLLKDLLPEDVWRSMKVGGGQGA